MIINLLFKLKRIKEEAKYYDFRFMSTMLVAAYGLHAVRYKISFDNYIKRKGYI